jgi:hypothetical protein
MTGYFLLLCRAWKERRSQFLHYQSFAFVDCHGVLDRNIDFHSISIALSPQAMIFISPVMLFWPQSYSHFSALELVIKHADRFDICFWFYQPSCFSSRGQDSNSSRSIALRQLASIE